jgi:tetratricopeptide (TPR) repeat protein
MAVVAFAMSVALMLPFFFWGVHLLRERYLLHRDIPMRVEVYSLLGVVAFQTVQLMLIRIWMGEITAFYAFTMLAIAAASTALYGPTLVSVVSQEIVNLMHPPHDARTEEPNFSMAEGLEQRCDYEGALREYMVMARVFPKDSETAFRVGHVLIELERFEEAAASFERGLHQAAGADPERALLATNRLSDLYRERLGRMDDAAMTLQAYLDRYGDTAKAELVARKLDRLRRNGTPSSNGNGSSAATPPANGF